MRRRRGDDLRLLSYKDGRSWRSVLPALVNEYVRASTGLEATAKDFRTWHATVLAAAALAETPEPGETKASRKRAVVGGDEGGRVVPRQHPDAGALVVRRPTRRSTPTRRAARSSARPGARYDTPDERQAALERATLRLMKEA